MDIKVKIPENLNIAQLLQANNIKPSDKLVDKIAFICHSLHNSGATRRDKLEEYNSNKIADRPYYPLSSVILKKYINDYNKVRDLLINDLKVIEWDGFYIIGQKTYNYRFSPEYFGVKFIPHTITDFTLFQNIKAYQGKKEIEVDTTDNNKAKIAAKYAFLQKYWDKDKLKIDLPAALDWINTIADTMLQMLPDQFPFDGFFKPHSDEYILGQKKIIENREKIIRLIERINEGDYSFGIDGSGYRFYTIFTGIKKEARNFITYQDQKLVAIDISNAVLYFLLAIFNQDFWILHKKTPKNLLTLQRIGLANELSKIDVNSLLSLIMLLKNSETPDNKGSQELENFTNLVTRGKIYDDFLADYKKQFKKSKIKTRDQMKTVFQIFLNNDPKKNAAHKYKNNPVTILSNTYPTITKILNTIKAKENNLVAKITQRIESYLMIEVICKRISKEIKAVPLFTIHDSIITTEKYRDDVARIMNEELKRFIGYEPPTKPDVWESNQSIYNYKDIVVRYLSKDELTEDMLALFK